MLYLIGLLFLNAQFWFLKQQILVDATHKQKFLGVFKSKSEDTKRFENYCYTAAEKAMAPTPVFLPGKPYGQRSLVGYSPQGHKESDTT